jgi:hypothetical protein
VLSSKPPNVANVVPNPEIKEKKYIFYVLLTKHILIHTYFYTYYESPLKKVMQTALLKNDY